MSETRKDHNIVPKSDYWKSTDHQDVFTGLCLNWNFYIAIQHKVEILPMKLNQDSSFPIQNFLILLETYFEKKKNISNEIMRKRMKINYLYKAIEGKCTLQRRNSTNSISLNKYEPYHQTSSFNTNITQFFFCSREESVSSTGAQGPQWPLWIHLHCEGAMWHTGERFLLTHHHHPLPPCQGGHQSICQHVLRLTSTWGLLHPKQRKYCEWTGFTWTSNKEHRTATIFHSRNTPL